MIYPDFVTVYDRKYLPEPAVQPPPSRPQYWRHPHDVELRLANVQADVTKTDREYRGAPTGKARASVLESGKTYPEVFQLLPNHITPLSDPWADFVCELNAPELPREKAMLIFDDHWAFNNYRDTPGFDKPRVCGGALLRGQVDGSNLMIESILSSGPIPDPEEVKRKPWLWYYGTQVAPTGKVTYMTLGVGDGVRVRVRVPLITKMPVYIPLRWLHKLPADFTPAGYDPLRVY